jgi:hypothetical protein
MVESRNVSGDRTLDGDNAFIASSQETNLILMFRQIDEQQKEDVLRLLKAFLSVRNCKA